MRRNYGFKEVRLNKILFFSFGFSTTLYILIVVKWGDHFNQSEIIVLSFIFSALGTIISLVIQTIIWKYKDKRDEEDREFDVYSNEEDCF